MRLRLVPEETNWDFFKWSNLWLGFSIVSLVASVVLYLTMGFNYGIDFLGGTTIRTESSQPVDIAAYRAALQPLGLGDVSITEIFDTNFRADQHVASVRIGAQGDGDASISAEIIAQVEAALKVVDPAVIFTAIESVGPKVSNELIQTAVIAVVLAMIGIMFYVWLRFEWQFSIGALLSLSHDIAMTVGLFCLLQIKFDLTIIAALLTIVGYSINDTVVVFDRVRENLRKYKKMDLQELLNLSINETLSRTTMTSFTTLLALFSLLIFGGDVIRGFVFAMTWGIFVGTYSSIFIASKMVLILGVKRDWSKAAQNQGNKYANIDN